MKKPKQPLAGWAVRLGIPGCAFYFAWSKDYPKGYGSPIGKKHPPLIFGTETEAEIARDAYLSMNENPWPSTVMQVRSAATHRLTNQGFAPVPLEESFPLFARP